MSDSFIIDIAQLRLMICGKDNAKLAESWRKLFRYHIATEEGSCAHRVVLCDAFYELPADAKWKWTSPLLGVSAKKQPVATSLQDSRTGSFFHRLIGRLSGKKLHMSQPVYSGSCSVSCYQDAEGRMFMIPEKGDWRLIHVPDKHVTYVYAETLIDEPDSPVAALLHVVGSQYGRYLLFASAIEESGEALLLIGHGGAGKTQACIDHIKQGARYMGDDLAMIYMQNNKAMVGALLFPAKVVTTQSLEKKRIDLVSTPVRQAPLKAVCELTRDHADFTQVELKHDTLVERLLDFTNSACTHDNAAQYVDVITDITNAIAFHP